MNNSAYDKSLSINRWDMFSKYRSVLMGFAILGIFLCHISLVQSHHGLTVSVFAQICHVFTTCVDIFMFLSGLGLYYSRRKKMSGGGYFQYLKKRILRIVPSYLVLGAITYTIADVIVNKGTFKQVVRDLFFITWFSDGSTRYWFILAILIFYAIFPLLYHFLHKDDKGFKRLLILLIGYIMVTGFLHYNFAYYERFMIAIERFPIFVFGVYCGKLSYEKKEVPKVGLIVISALAVIFTFLYYTSHSVRAWISNTHYVYYFLWGILGLWMCFTIIFVLEKISTYWESGYKGIVKVLSFIGNMTLEVYLFHQSYLIVFDYPYSIAGFLFVAIILPILSASMVHKIKSGFLNQKR